MQPEAAEPAVVVGPHPEKAAAAQELVGGILVRMGVQAELAVEDLPDGIHVRLSPREGLELLAGPKQGGVIESITYLVNKSINRDEVGRKWVFVELAGDGDAPAQVATSAALEVPPALRAMAQELVGKAKRMGGALWLGPLPASRRGLQAALAAEPGVRVRAEGEGIHRRLCIEVDEKAVGP